MGHEGTMVYVQVRLENPLAIFCIIAAVGCLRFVASIITPFKKGKSLCERSSIRIVTVLFFKGGLPFEFTAIFCVIAAVIIDDHAHVKDGKGGACITDQVLFWIYLWLCACVYVRPFPLDLALSFALAFFSSFLVYALSLCRSRSRLLLFTHSHFFSPSFALFRSLSRILSCC